MCVTGLRLISIIFFLIQDLKMAKQLASNNNKASTGRVAKAATESYPVRWDYPSSKEADTRDELIN